MTTKQHAKLMQKAQQLACDLFCEAHPEYDDSEDNALDFANMIRHEEELASKASPVVVATVWYLGLMEYIYRSNKPLFTKQVSDSDFLKSCGIKE